MKGHFAKAVAITSVLILLGTYGVAQSDAWEFQDSSCREVLKQHPGTYPAHAAGHSRQEETASEERRRTGNQERYHRKITYWALLQVKDCLRSLSHSLGADAQRRNSNLERVQERLSRLEEALRRLEGKLNDILRALPS